MLEPYNLQRHHRREDESQRHDLMFKIRNVLNIAFMLIAIVGVCFYLSGDAYRGIIIVLIAMAIKFAEATIRFMKQSIK